MLLVLYGKDCFDLYCFDDELFEVMVILLYCCSDGDDFNLMFVVMGVCLVKFVFVL